MFEGFPERSVAAKSAKTVLYDEYNTIDIFVEDTAQGYEKIFVEIFSRVFEGHYQVSDVFPLGARNVVIEQFKAEHKKITKPTLYIIDGDIFLLLGECHAESPGLYSLPYYCIENILLDENAILKFLNEEDIFKKRDQLNADFDYAGWIKQNYDLMREIFLTYATVFKLCPTLKTISFPVSQLTSCDKGLLNADKVFARISEVSAETISLVGREAFDETYQKVRSIYDVHSNPYFTFPSGKDYLLPLLLKRIRSTVKVTTTNVNLKLRLAMNCDIEKLNDVIKYVIKPQ